MGKCPHVNDDVPREVLQTTCVTGAHIVVAKSDDKPMIEDTDDIQFDHDDYYMQIHDPFGKIRHNSRIKSWLWCM